MSARDFKCLSTNLKLESEAFKGILFLVTSRGVYIVYLLTCVIAIGNYFLYCMESKTA